MPPLTCCEPQLPGQTDLLWPGCSSRGPLASSVGSARVRTGPGHLSPLWALREPWSGPTLGTAPAGSVPGGLPAPLGPAYRATPGALA